MPELLSGTVTFLFSDIEGSTRLLKQLRDRYGDALAEHQRVLREAFERHNGSEIDTQGDSFFIAFPTAREAVLAALEAQLALARQTWPDGAELRVRMGIHTGQAAVAGERYIGVAVHRAARICAAGHGGQVLVSQTTHNLLEDEEEELGDIELRDLGEKHLKDLDRPVRLYQLVSDGLEEEFPPLRTAESPFAGREGELVEAAEAVLVPRWRRHRTPLVAALAVVVAVAIAIPVFALGGASRAATVQGDSVVRVDPGSNAPADDIPVSGIPRDVAFGDGAIWATNSDTNTVFRIDPKAGNVTQTISVGAGPAGVAVSGGSVWVANSLAGTVSRISPKTNAVVQTIATGNGPAGVAVGLGSVWVTNSDDRNVVQIDPSSGRVRRRFQLGGVGPGIAVGAGAVWVADEGAGAVTKLDPATGAQQQIAVGNGPTGVAAAGNSIWVANSLDGTVSRISVRTNGVTATIPVGDGAGAIATGPGVVWVSSEFAGTLTRIDTGTSRVVRVIRIGNRPSGVAVSPAGPWVAVQSAGLAHRGGTLRIVSNYALDSNAATAYDQASWELLTTTNDGLVAFQHVGGSVGLQLVPDLATSVPKASDEGRSYTFQVRRGIPYSAGGVVKASDFRSEIERTFAAGSPGASYFQNLVGASACLPKSHRCDLSRGIAVDDQAGTITFHLTKPDPDFLTKLAIPFAYAVPPGAPRKGPSPATGPYMIAAGSTPRDLREVRNPRFRPWSGAAQPAGYPDRIIWTYVASDSAATTAVERGKFDLVFSGPPRSRLPSLRTRFPSQLHIDPSLATFFFFLNTSVPPFSSAEARRAVNLAIDRTRVVRIEGGRSIVRPTCQILPPDSVGYRRYCLYPYDPLRARKLVAASGTRGARVTIWNWASDPARVRIARYAASVLRRLGYRVSVRQVTDANRYFTAVTDPRTKVQMGFEGWSADFPSAAQYIQPNFTCAALQASGTPPATNNTSRFCDPAIDREVARATALQSREPQAAVSLWAAIDRRIMKRAPWVPLLTSTTIQLVSSRVGNWEYNPQWGVLVGQLWVR